jgi:hypothetical protein
MKGDRAVKLSLFLLTVATSALLFLTIRLLYGGVTAEANAQVGSVRYLWSDSVATNTTGQDVHFSIRWEQVTVKVYEQGGWVRYGSPDTTSWSSREWIRLDPGETISFGPGTPLVRLQYKSQSGVSIFYFSGYKLYSEF